MKLNKNEHSRFVRELDRTAEKNPLLWLPCILLVAFALAGEHIVGHFREMFSCRNTEKTVKKESSLERKPLFMRIVALTLVISLSFMYTPEISDILSINAYAAENWNDDFDLEKYIAYDIVYTKEDPSDNTNFYSDIAKKRMDYYFDDFRTMSEIWMDSMTPEFENSVRLWETTNLILSPGDIGEKMVDAREYYVTIILSMMNSSYESNTIVDDLYNNTKDGGKILKQFSEFFQAKTNCELRDFLKQSSYSKEERKMLEDVQKEWLKDNKWVKNIEAADDILDIIKAADNMQEYVDSFVSYCQISNVCAEWKDIINYMYNKCDRSNYALVSALESFKNYMESEDMTNAAFNMLLEKGVNDFASWGISKCVDEITDLIIDRFPAFSGIKIGSALGKTLSNMLTGTDKIVEEYQMVKAYCEVLNLLKRSYKEAESRYKNNKTHQNASAFLSYVNIYFTALQIGNDYGKEFADAICNGGIVNKIMYSKEQYSKFVEWHKFFGGEITSACEMINTNWIINLYWDRPDLYEIYAPYIKNVGFIDPTRVEFEKDSVEWGLDDVAFNGAKYTVYPNEATDKEVIITSSDESVATLDNYGNVKVFKAGVCQITVTTYANEFVSDTLNVTVVDGKGADSYSFDLIEPITPEFVSQSNFEYDIWGNEVTITKYVGIDTNVTIPKIISGKPVTNISGAFEDNEDIISVEIPIGVTSISWSAFENCTSLANVTIPDSVISIGYDAFSGCIDLTSITIPDSVTSIGNFAFYDCTSLTNIILPDSVTSIGDNAFHNCTGLTSITIPDSVTSIGNFAFYDCTSLTNIIIPDSITSIGNSVFSDCTSLTSITIPDSVTSIGISAFYDCTSLTDVIIPDSVTSIGNSAFYNCTSLTDVIIPDSVTSIGNYAFSDCTNLTKITIPDSVTSIGDYALDDCVNLTSITIPNSVTSIGKWSFEGFAKLENITLPSSITSIEDRAFYNCTVLVNVTIPNGVTSLGNSVFSGCIGLTNIIIPNSVTSIGDYAFNGCTSLTSITIPDSVTSICNYAFNNCINLTNITIPDSITSIGNYAFKNCTNLTNIIIPDSVTTIGDSAFRDCTGLTSITIPNNVTSIGNYAFDNCTNLTNITIPDSVTSLGYWSFEGFTKLENILLPNCVFSIGSYAFDGCTSLTNIIIPDSVTSIGNFAFNDCTSLANITIPNSVTSMGDYAFDDCTSLINITIPNSVTSIGDCAFDGCSNLTSIIIPDSVTSIGDNAFRDCTSLTGITIPDSVTSLGYWSFEGFTKLENITLPDCVTSIGNYAFNDCISLTNITIPESVGSIGIWTFGDCTSLTNITIPNSVTSIGSGAFCYCKRLEKITIPNNVTSIGDDAFYNCTSLTSITIPNSVTSIGGRAFHYCTNLTIYGYRNSYAENYAKDNNIPFVYLDNIPTDNTLSVIESVDENTTISVDTSKYGTDLTIEEVSAAKNKNLTLVVNGNNFSWKVSAINLPNTAVDFRLLSPSGNVDSSQFNDIYKNRNFDIKTSNPSGAELTYNVGAENNGYCANIFKVESGNFALVSSALVNNGYVTFVPSDNATYCIVISTDSNPIGIDELFKKTSAGNSALDSLSVNGITFSDFSPNKTDYTFSVAYADWFVDKNKIYSISAYADNSASVTVSDNNFVLNSIDSDMAASKDITISVSTDSEVRTVYTIKFVIEACPHINRSENISKEPTCAELDEKETVCSLCGKSFGVENIPALGHDFDNGTTTLKPDCINVGTVTYQCSRCSESFTRTIPALGHNWSKLTVDTAADCINDGISLRYCTVCGAHDSVTLIPALGHSFGEWTKVNDTTYERVCSVCGTAETKTVSSTDHDHIFNGAVDVITPATCQDCGFQNVHCSIDGCTEFVTETISRTSHTPTEAITVNATCTTAGSSTVTCAVCGVQITKEEIPPTGHSFTKYTDTATCIIPGIKTAECDNGCGANDCIPTPAKGHNYGSWYSDSTGHWHECSVCGSRTDIISHSEDNGVITIQPTETTDGIKTYSCTECGYVIRTETIKKLNPVPPDPGHLHIFDTIWHSDTASHWHECSCGEKSDIGYHNENGGVVTVEPTETSTGVRTYSCTVCGYVMRTESIPIPSPEHIHSFGTNWTYDNTNHWHECSCGERSDTDRHTDNGGIVTAQPTSITSGTKVHSCTVCGCVIYTETIPASGTIDRPNNTNHLPDVLPTPIFPSDRDNILNKEVELSVRSELTGLSSKGAHIESIRKFFSESATILLTETADSQSAAEFAMNSFDNEKMICYPFDISVYSTATGEKIQLRHSGYITFEIPVPESMVNISDSITVYHIADGIPEHIESEIITDTNGNKKIKFTAKKFSPYMFTAETAEDITAEAAATASSSDFTGPVSNGVTVPAMKLPRIIKWAGKKKKFRVIKKRCINDILFAF